MLGCLSGMTSGRPTLVVVSHPVGKIRSRICKSWRVLLGCVCPFRLEGKTKSEEKLLSSQCTCDRKVVEIPGHVLAIFPNFWEGSQARSRQVTAKARSPTLVVLSDLLLSPSGKLGTTSVII